MVATSFAAVPSQSQLQAIMTAANAGVPGNYATLKQLAAQLHNAALTYTAIANANRNDGSLAKWDATIRASKTQMIGEPTGANLNKVYGRMVALGYQGSFQDFTRSIPATATARAKAYAVGTASGLYKVMIQAAQGFQAAADAINQTLLASRSPAQIVDAGFHYHILRIIRPETCAAIDWGIGFLALSSLFTPSMILAPVWAGAAIVWGVARSEAGCL
jgi:hypothetical protein